MEVNCENSCLNSTGDHCSPDISIANVVRMLQQLLDSSSFNVMKIMSTVTLLKQMRDNVVHCDVESNSFIKNMEESSPTSTEIDGVIKQAESFLDMFAEEAKFNGEILDWFLFWESFEREIHNQKDLPIGVKFACLKHRLEGWPLNMISKLGSGDSAYNEAIKLLQKAFSNKKLLVESHLNALLDLECPTATSISLMQFSSDFEYHIRALKAYGTSIEEAGFFVVAVLNKKLPKETWNRINKAESTIYWTLPEFEKALKFEIQLLNFELSQQANNDSAVNLQKTTVVTIGEDSACKSEAEGEGQDSSKHSFICQLCSGCHVLTACTQYKTSVDKVERALQLGFCLLCISSDHSTDKCSMASCKFCNGRHSTFLCVSADSKARNKKAKSKKKNKKRKKKLKNIKHCPLCSEIHDITGCTVYKTSLQRMKRAKVLELCLLCIKDKHTTEQCPKKAGCKFCKGKHNTLLCAPNSEVCDKKSEKKCPFCSGSHDETGCIAYKSPVDKMERAKERNLCVLCLKDDHTHEKCLGTNRCKFCRGKHNTLLCHLEKTELKEINVNLRNLHCILCGGSNHEFGGCPSFKTNLKRQERALTLNLCQLCLKDTHKTEECSSSKRCKSCRGKHNASICPFPHSIGKLKKEKKTEKQKQIIARGFNGPMQGIKSRAGNYPVICPLCSSKHHFGMCLKYKTSVEKRVQATRLNLCLLCLDTHPTSVCLKSKGCKFCGGGHHTCLCIESDKALGASDKEAKKERRRKRKEEKRQQKNALINNSLISDFIMSSHI